MTHLSLNPLDVTYSGCLPPFLPAFLRTLLSIQTLVSLCLLYYLSRSHVYAITSLYIFSRGLPARLLLVISACGERNSILSLSLSLSTLTANSPTDSLHQLLVKQQGHRCSRYRSPRERERDERESDLSYNMTCSGKAKLWSLQPRDPPLCWDCS